MTLRFLSIPAAVLAATTLAASPALAQRRGESHENHQAEHRSSAEHAQPRAEAPRQQAPAPRVEQRAEPRAEQRAQPPAEQRAQPRAEQRVQPRAEQRVQPQREVIAPRGEVRNGVAVPRAVPRYDNRYSGGHYDNHYYYNGHYYSGPWRGWYGYSPFRPYYFRPHFSLGFGLYLGYPVPYYAYPYQVPVYGYGAPYGEVSVGPNDTAYGGVALQITPSDAAVYVDGNYAGIVSDFDGSRQPLTLVPGQHHIEIDQTGFEPWAFDVTVQAGMVIPYQGSLRPY